MNNFWKVSCLIITSLIYNYAASQATVPGNTPAANAVLGWNDANNTVLNINQNNSNRIRLTSINWAGLGTTNTTGATRISIADAGQVWGNNSSNQNSNPFSILHLGNQIGPTLQRPWMNIGTTYVANGDILYAGLLEQPLAGNGNPADTDAVLAWGCNDNNYYGATGGPDNFRFLFITPTTYPQAGGTPGAGATIQGRETMRITPMGNVGVGDFSSMPQGLNQQPTHRLDVDGNVRVRQIPLNTPNVLITGAQQDAVGDYELSYLAFNGNQNMYLAGDGTWQSTNTGNQDCDWATNPDGDVVTGVTVPGQWGCSQLERVGIGISDPEDYKFEVTDDLNGFTGFGCSSFTSVINNAGRAVNMLTENGGIGTYIKVDGGSTVQNVGARINVGTDGESQTMYGVNSRAHNSGQYTTMGNAYGVYGYACDARYNYGIYGDVCLPPSGGGTTHWAGYFNGPGFITNGPWQTSDANLKQDIQDIESGIDIINSLAPKHYSYNQEAYPQMNLPSGTQFGLLAQDAEQVLPNMVTETVHPAQYDEEGVLISEEVAFKAMNYSQLIPILIKATQEQQVLIESQQSQIADLIAAVNDCCALDFIPKTDSVQPDIQLLQDGSPVNELGQNFPNPFENSTTIAYQVACNCMATIRIMDHTGKTIEVLVNETKAAGNYQIEWNASDLASGMYYYSLEVDGQELVRKAIKL